MADSDKFSIVKIGFYYLQRVDKFNNNAIIENIGGKKDRID